MEPTNCNCSAQKVLSFEEISLCRDAIGSVYNWHQPPRGIETGVFGARDLLGYFSTREGSNWDDCALAVPFSFGMLTARVTTRNSVIDRVDLPELDVALYSVRNDIATHLVSARFIAAQNPEGIAIETEQRVKSYDWRCLAKCAPSCIACVGDLQCWVICAGACVISCAL
ncbi:hypothetical protein [Tahibacter caeni]|uniref:hypothetical protein n=1 Tax=Tahibacter caeni TaxID=1453545 RepID=UPI0021484F94|nr:hypothetical protein [Tahibacter caeni]